MHISRLVLNSVAPVTDINKAQPAHGPGAFPIWILDLHRATMFAVESGALKEPATHCERGASTEEQFIGHGCYSVVNRDVAIGAVE